MQDEWCNSKRTMQALQAGQVRGRCDWLGRERDGLEKELFLKQCPAQRCEWPTKCSVDSSGATSGLTSAAGHPDWLRMGATVSWTLQGRSARRVGHKKAAWPIDNSNRAAADQTRLVLGLRSPPLQAETPALLASHMLHARCSLPFALPKTPGTSPYLPA